MNINEGAPPPKVKPVDVPPEETPVKEWEKFAKRQENAKKNAEKFGYTVSINTETSTTPALEETKKVEVSPEIPKKPEKVSEVRIETEKDRQDRIKEAAFRAQQAKDTHIGEAEGLLGELARRSNQEALTKQVDEDLKTAAGPETTPAEQKEKDLKEWREWFGPELTGQVETEKKMFVPTPEQLKGIESVKTAAAAQEAANQKKAEKLGVWGTIKQVGSKFRDLPLLAAVKITEGMRSLALQVKKHPFFAAAAVGGILAAIYMRYNASPDMDIGTVPPLEPAPTTPVTTEALPVIPSPGIPPIFGGEAMVSPGDTVWGLVEDRLAENATFVKLDRAQQDFVLDSYMKHLQSFGTKYLQGLGIPSGDINVIHIGERIDFSDLDTDRTLFDTFVSEARALTDAQKANILKARQ